MMIAVDVERSATDLTTTSCSDVSPPEQQPNKKVQRAARVANFNGWATAIVAGLSAPFAFFSVIGGLVCVSLAAVAYNEFRGRRRLLKLDPSGATLLGWNQLGLLALIIGYCGWMIFTGLSSPNPLAAEVAANPELGAILGTTDQFDALYRQVIVGFYGLVIAVSAIFQGLNAVYYFTRRKHVERQRREAPVLAGKQGGTDTPDMPPGADARFVAAAESVCDWS